MKMDELRPFVSIKFSFSLKIYDYLDFFIYKYGTVNKICMNNLTFYRFSLLKSDVDIFIRFEISRKENWPLGSAAMS